MSFKDTKAIARRRKITDAQRTAAKKNRILEGFQCPHKRCMHILETEEFRKAAEDYSCPRCAASAEEFTPLMVDHRKVKPPKPEDVLGFDNNTP
jgi:predicted RNA-binding Zn-ribbon protein involved in translation (DUF1610 family)